MYLAAGETEDYSAREPESSPRPTTPGLPAAIPSGRQTPQSGSGTGAQIGRETGLHSPSRRGSRPTGAYHDALGAATTAATRATVEERERAEDRRIVHAIRAMDDVERVTKELTARIDERAGILEVGEDDGSLQRAQPITEKEGSTDGSPIPTGRSPPV